MNGQRVTSAVSTIHQSLRHTHTKLNGATCDQLCPTVDCEMLKQFNTLLIGYILIVLQVLMAVRMKCCDHYLQFWSLS